MMLLNLPKPSAERFLPVNTIVATPETLSDLLKRARQGDARALEELCQKMRPHLYRVALSVLRNSDEADDVAQDALIRALERHSLFLGRGSLKAWMSRIALNLAKNRIRDRSRHKELLAQAAPVELQPTHGQNLPTPNEALSLQRLTQRVQECVDLLPARQRDVLRLRLGAEMGFAEIAKTLRISEANARVCAGHGLKKLRPLLKEEKITLHSGEKK
jgi:RNA polymerase sigma-70 factor, ECF subfamily